MEVLVNRVYKHFKGKLYIVESIAKDAETLEQIVLYRQLYGEGEVWIRPLSNFVEEVNREGQKYRFELVQE